MSPVEIAKAQSHYSEKGNKKESNIYLAFSEQTVFQDITELMNEHSSGSITTSKFRRTIKLRKLPSCNPNDVPD